MIYIYIKEIQGQQSREGNLFLSGKAQHTSLHTTPEWLIPLRERKTYRDRPGKPSESACYRTQLTENMKKCSGLLQPASIIQIYSISTSQNLLSPHITLNLKEIKKKKKKKMKPILRPF